MSARETSRRDFIFGSLSGIGAAWVAANTVGIEDAYGFVQQTAGKPPAFTFFTPEQAAEVEAMAAQIIPTDSTPGAREARCVVFIDRILSTFEKDAQPQYLKGLDELQSQTKQLFPTASKFSSLGDADQIKVLTAMEKGPFFNLVRTHTITGFFAAPVHGGNVNKVGWKLVNYDDSLHHKPPFGYYDALPQATTNQG